MTYIATTDLKTGDATISSKIDLQEYLDQAFDEMTVRLGECYEIPLPNATEFLALEEQDQASLQLIQTYLATGFLFNELAGTTGSERQSQYAEWCLQRAKERISAVCSTTNLAVRLDWPALNASVNSTDPNVPSNSDTPIVSNADGSSPVETYYAYLHGEVNTGEWYPSS
ncbi:MAG: hypothetical protein KJN71_04220 [Acidimicrobiia bacterium]|nr:hypothetical protein [Acidimicrobiia bacterium]